MIVVSNFAFFSLKEENFQGQSLEGEVWKKKNKEWKKEEHLTLNFRPKPKDFKP